jgi:PhnB protein
MPQLTAYLSFDGTCAEAFRFYEGALNGTLIALMKNGETPAAEHMPPGNEDRIMHACLDLGNGTLLMGGDAAVNAGDDCPKFEGMKGFMVAVTYDDTAEAQRVFERLSDGGSVQMPWSPTFWAEGFGMVTDKYGTPWGINGKQLMGPNANGGN